MKLRLFSALLSFLSIVLRTYWITSYGARLSTKPHIWLLYECTRRRHILIIYMCIHYQNHGACVWFSLLNFQSKVKTKLISFSFSMHACVFVCELALISRIKCTTLVLYIYIPTPHLVFQLWTVNLIGKIVGNWIINWNSDSGNNKVKNVFCVQSGFKYIPKP